MLFYWTYQTIHAADGWWEAIPTIGSLGRLDSFVECDTVSGVHKRGWGTSWLLYGRGDRGEGRVLISRVCIFEGVVFEGMGAFGLFLFVPDGFKRHVSVVFVTYKRRRLGASLRKLSL